MNSIEYLLSIETKGIKLGLNRTKLIMQACGNPQNEIKAIQVAGTNGKGSVCAIIAKILKEANYKTGLFTSPHLINVNERIRINGIPIKNTDIDNFIQSYKNYIEKFESTFFETITALAFWYFKKCKVDIAIMETGLGGRLDSVSICKPIATIITPISLDHTDILGNTLEQIAYEKSGIMKKNINCFCAIQTKKVKNVLIKEAKKKKCLIYFMEKNIQNNYKINLNGKIQKDNALLAINALQNIKEFHINNHIIKNALKKLIWHGRYQFLKKNPTIIFDVAHNEEGIKKFLQYYKTLKIKGKSVLVLALYSKKNINKIINNIETIFDYIICTETNGKKPMPAQQISNFFSSKKIIKTIKNPIYAIQAGEKLLDNNSGMAILGTHCLGPAINKLFKISFDSI